jgi:hypothetical protein
VSPSSTQDLTALIQSFDQAGTLTIKDRHIEVDRIYRNITLAHVRQVLSNGAVTHIRSQDKSVLWQGQDMDGRVLELNITLKDGGGAVVDRVKEAKSGKVGTAYDPRVSEAEDKKAMDEYLKAHTDWEKRPDGKGVQRKLIVVRV